MIDVHASRMEDGKLVIEVPAVPPSPNRYNGAHWSRYRNAKKAWMKHVWIAIAAGEGTRRTFPRAKVHILRENQRLLDPDNAVASCKCLIDALRDNRVIEDDSAKHIELLVTQAVRKKAKTTIRIEALQALGAIDG